MRFINNPWVSGIGTGLLVFALTSGLVARFDVRTIALMAVVAVLAGVLATVLIDNRGLRTEVARLSTAPQFDPETGFCFMPEDSEHKFPMCPDCAANGRKMSLHEQSNGWICQATGCQFFKAKPLDERPSREDFDWRSL